MVEVATRGRFAGCPRCGALYVVGEDSGACSVCSSPRPSPRSERLVDIARVASKATSRAPSRRREAAVVVFRAAALWAVIVGAVVWALT